MPTLSISASLERTSPPSVSGVFRCAMQPFEAHPKELARATESTGEEFMRDVISAPVPGLNLGQEYGHHQSPAIRAGGLIFCSGMVAINPKTGEREHGTVTNETRRIFENLKLLLESSAPNTATSGGVPISNWYGWSSLTQ